MKNKQILLIAFLIGISSICKSQSIVSAKFRISDSKKGIRSIELTLDNNLVIGIDKTGLISYVDDGKDTDKHFETTFEDYNKEGKVHNVGDFKVDYYDQFDINDPMGKIKSIGNILFTYYNKFDIHDEFGALKSVGDIKITNYNVFDINDPKGKVKTIGNVKIEYYNKFDINDPFGKIKSIQGNNNHIYVTKSRS